MAGVCGGSGFNKGLSMLPSASIAMSHISRLSARENVTDKRAGHEKVLRGEGPVLWKDGHQASPGCSRGAAHARAVDPASGHSHPLVQNRQK